MVPHAFGSPAPFAPSRECLSPREMRVASTSALGQSLTLNLAAPNVGLVAKGDIST